MVTIASLDPEPSIPQTITELFGIPGSGIAALVTTGTLVEPVLKVSTPVEETLNVETGAPLKSKAKGIVSIGDHTGVLLLPPSSTSHEASNPDPLGYSLSVFSPPGFPCVVLGR